MTDKVQKIREEIEKLKSRLIRGACASQIAMETYCKEEAYNEVLAILDSMKEEPVSDDLEDYALQYAGHYAPYDSCMQEVKDAVKAGSNWKEQQMIANAIDAEVLENYDGKVIKYDDTILDKKLSGCKVFDKVKVIVIKEK